MGPVGVVQLLGGVRGRTCDHGHVARDEVVAMMAHTVDRGMKLEKSFQPADEG